VALEQEPERLAIDPHVVRDDGEIASSGIADRLDQVDRHPAEAEAAHGDGHAVAEGSGEGLRRATVHFRHGVLSIEAGCQHAEHSNENLASESQHC